MSPNAPYFIVQGRKAGARLASYGERRARQFRLTGQGHGWCQAPTQVQIMSFSNTELCLCGLEM